MFPTGATAETRVGRVILLVLRDGLFCSILSHFMETGKQKGYA